MSVPFYGLNRRYVVRIGLLVVLTLAFAAISPSPDASAAIPMVEATPSPAKAPTRSRRRRPGLPIKRIGPTPGSGSSIRTEATSI
jgi:hypothetical protein